MRQIRKVERLTSSFQKELVEYKNRLRGIDKVSGSKFMELQNKVDEFKIIKLIFQLRCKEIKEVILELGRLFK